MGIYEDVALLQEQMTAAQEQLAALTVTPLTEGTDLHTLTVGKYIVPSAAICATLLNKPTTSNATAFINVIESGNAGQLTIFYIPCTKETASYYHAAFYQDAWGAWNTVNLTDTGWLDLPLADGITAYSEGQKPRYRRVGKEVFVSGVLKGATATNQTVATLPSGYRPSKKVMFPIACVGQMIGKISIETSGEIILNRTTVEPVLAENWHSIACSFNVD